jgi:hypothetical protein
MSNRHTSVVDPDVGVLLKEIVRAEVYRGRPDGGYGSGPDEVLCVEDLITNTGRQFIARRIAGGDAQTAPGSAMAYMVVGTGSTSPALTDGTTPGLYGEVKRKALSTNSAGISAANVYTAVATLGGAADTVTSVQIQEAGVYNHASSGQGTQLQRVTFSAVTLADSDLLKLTLETNVGSS